MIFKQKHIIKRGFPDIGRNSLSSWPCLDTQILSINYNSSNKIQVIGPAEHNCENIQPQ